MKFNFKKTKRQETIKGKMYLDRFIYVFLLIFVLMCFGLHLNFLFTSVLAISFVIVIFGLYLLEYKLKSTSLINSPYADKVDNMTKGELKEFIKKYYINLGYKILENQKYLIIQKNIKKYRVLFFINQISINNLKSILNTKKEISGTIIITNCDISKEVRNFIKENKLFSITRPGLVEILKNLELQNEDTEDRKEVKMEEDNNG